MNKDEPQGATAPRYTSAMGHAADRYLYRVSKFAHPLPQQFRWEDCYAAMLAAADSTVSDAIAGRAGVTAQPALTDELDREYDERYRLLGEAHLPSVEAAAPPTLTDAARDVLTERRRQVEAEGWTPEHDDEHSDGGMAVAAACYALADRGKALAVNTLRTEKLWEWTGWAWWWFKPKDRRSNLVKAGALILAEIERLDRAAQVEAAAPRTNGETP
jgi:hypothetical protein